jgi:hypothetical protein
VWPPGTEPAVEHTDIDDWLAVIATGRRVGITPESTVTQYRRQGIEFRPLRDADPVPVGPGVTQPGIHVGGGGNHVEDVGLAPPPIRRGHGLAELVDPGRRLRGISGARVHCEMMTDQHRA